MPIFEYRCDHCGQTQEKIQSKPENHIPCSACGKTASRTVSLAAVSASSGGGGCSAPSGSGFT